MQISFNDWDSELVEIARSIERYAAILNLEVAYDEDRLRAFVESRALETIPSRQPDDAIGKAVAA